MHAYVTCPWPTFFFLEKKNLIIVTEDYLPAKRDEVHDVVHGGGIVNVSAVDI